MLASFRTLQNLLVYLACFLLAFLLALLQVAVRAAFIFFFLISYLVKNPSLLSVFPLVAWILSLALASSKKQLGVVHWIEISLRRPRRPHSYSLCAVPYSGSTCCALPCFGQIHEFRHSNDLHGLHHLSPYGRCGYSVEAEGGRDGGREGDRERGRKGERGAGSMLL